METIKHLEMNDKKSTYLNMWDLSKTKLRGKCIVLNTFIRKQELLRMNKLSICIMKVWKEQTKSKLHNKIIVKKEQKQKQRRGSMKAKVSSAMKTSKTEIEIGKFEQMKSN